MRRMTSVFLTRRVDKPDAPSSNDVDPLPQEATKRKVSMRMFQSLSRKAVPPQLFASGSSSSTSSGSAELRTPDDEESPHVRIPSQKGSWRSWLGAKNQRGEGDTKAAWLPPFSTPGMHYTDDASSESEDGADHLQDPPTQNFAQSITQARNSMRVMILNSCSDCDRPSCPPLLDIPQTHHTLESKMHKAVLLKSLESLSPADSDACSLAPLGSRPVTMVKEAPVCDSDVDIWPKKQFLRSNSEGLGNWVARPCYEDREPSGEIVTSRITGSQFGVAALEFSDPLQILAGWLSDVDDGLDPSAELQPESSQPASGAAEVALPSTAKLNPPVAVADFDLSHLTLAVDSPESKKETGKLKAVEPTPAPAVKRGVRFAEDGKDDQIPLGHVLRIKKKREEKARFLREEREKRELKEERRALGDRRMREEERRLQEAQLREQEEEHKARELHRKRIEEERRQKNFTSELQASRTRREASRAGHISSSPSLVRDIERDRSASRDARTSGSPSTRQQTTDLKVSPANLSPYDGSPASSMPATPGSQHSFSRPPSVYSTYTSSDDARGRDGRHISKRVSAAFDPSKQLSLPLLNPRASLLPYNPWGSMQVPPFAVPPISPFPAAPMMAMPFYSLDPLLPPSPPFMMNQFGMTNQFGIQPYSANSYHGQVPSSPRQSSFSNHSAEGIRHTSRAVPNSSGYSSNHQRRASDETRGHPNSSNVTADRKYGSQTDLRDKRSSSQAAHSSRSSGLHRSHQPPVLVHAHTAPGRPAPTSQSRSTSSRRQSVYP
ncbi:hypothetical protein BDR07DRAFT_1393611 [Suillus spraguei]|nr:hypothetical protein BDR07DRAFT_1393611 [Suillus spraguei]